MYEHKLVAQPLLLLITDSSVIIACLLCVENTCTVIGMIKTLALLMP